MSYITIQPILRMRGANTLFCRIKTKAKSLSTDFLISSEFPIECHAKKATMADEVQ